MAQPYPLPRETRETAILVGDGGTEYGPFTFRIFDDEDVVALVKRDGADVFSEEAITVEKTADEPLDTFSVIFGTALEEADSYVIIGKRTHERLAAVTRGGAINGEMLEKELSKQAAVIQELRRDADRAVAVMPSFGPTRPVIPEAGKVIGFDADLQPKMVPNSAAEAALEADRAEEEADRAEAEADRAEEEADRAQQAADASEGAEGLAQKWAENPEDEPVVPDRFSALHHAAKAEESAELAQLAATAAATEVADVYEDTEAALLATTDGDRFWIWGESGGEQVLLLYLNDDGTAVSQDLALPSHLAISSRLRNTSDDEFSHRFEDEHQHVSAAFTKDGALDLTKTRIGEGTSQDSFTLLFADRHELIDVNAQGGRMVGLDWRRGRNVDVEVVTADLHLIRTLNESSSGGTSQSSGSPAHRGKAVLFDGDSRVDQSSNPGRTTAAGWIWPLQVLTGARFDFQPSYNFGKAGEESSEMYARIAAVKSMPPSIVITLISINDTNAGLSAAQSIVSLQAYQDEILQVHDALIWVAELPMGDGLGNAFSDGLTGDALDAHLALRRWFLDQASVPGVYVADPWPKLVDPGSANAKGKDDEFYDGLHFGARVGRAIADEVAPIINHRLPPRPRLVASNADLYSAKNARGALNPNPLMLGTGGTIGTGGSGDLADDWTATIGAGITAVFSKVVDDEGVEWQQVDFEGAPTGTNPGGSPIDPTPFSIVVSAPIGDLSIGDRCEGQGAIHLEAGSTGLRGVALYTSITTDGSTVTYAAGEPSAARSVPNLDLPPLELSGVAMVPISDPAAGDVSSASISVVIAGAPYTNAAEPNAVPLSGTVRFRAVSAHKV